MKTLRPASLLFRRRNLLKAASVVAAPLPRATAGAAAPPLALDVHKDGSFDIAFGPLILRGAYPALDDRPLHPVAVHVQHDAGTTQITYDLDVGKAILTLGQEPSGVFIDMVLQGLPTAPHWVFPLASAQVVGANRFFKQGLGFGGPSGLYPIAKAGNTHAPNHLTESAWSYDSFMTTALVADTQHTLLTGALAHQDYLQRSTLYNKSHRRELVEKRPALDDVLLEAGFSTERIPLPDKRLVLPRLYVLPSMDLQTSLDNWAHRLAQANSIKLKSQPRFHWDSWYEFYEGHDTARLQDTLTGMNQTKPPVPFAGVLIDAGYGPAGDWTNADERIYKGGLQSSFAMIKDAGFAPGIWISPFMVSSLSRVYKEHPDWMVHDRQGKAVVHGKGKPFFYVYATHEERFYLDTTHPGAFAFLRETFRTLRKWGAKSYKLDFMEWGFKDSTTIRRHKPGRTSTQNFVDVLRMIKDEIGPDAYFHGCITPFAPMLGLADGMRVGYDVDTDTWKEDGSTINMFQETIATQYMNNVLWQNDPDVLYVRDGSGTTRLNDDEAVSLALWNGILGGVVSTSDRPHRLAPDRLALLRFVQPGTRYGKARFPLWTKQGGQHSFGATVAVRDYPDLQAHAVLVLNQGETLVEGSVPLADLDVAGASYVFAWRPGAAQKIGASNSLSVKLGRHQSALFYVCKNNKPPAANQGLAGEPVSGLPV